MSILAMATADLQSVNTGIVSAYTEASATTARTGTYSYLISNWPGGYIVVPFTSVQTLYGRVAFTGRCQLDLKQLTYFLNAYAIRLVFDSDNFLKLYKYNYSLLDSVAYTLNAWNYIEFYVYSHPTAGECIVKLNGVEVINVTGVDTSSTTENKMQYLVITSLGAFTYHYDDIIIRTDTWPGPGGLYVLKPNAGSTNENWSASTGNPEDCVDDLPVSFTDYISTPFNTPDTEHLVGIESLPATPTSIGGVGVFANAKVNYLSDAKLRTLLKSGTTTDTGTGIHVSDDGETWVSKLYHQNPDDSAAWENADIDAIEIGVETQ